MIIIYKITNLIVYIQIVSIQIIYTKVIKIEINNSSLKNWINNKNIEFNKINIDSNLFIKSLYKLKKILKLLKTKLKHNCLHLYYINNSNFKKKLK